MGSVLLPILFIHYSISHMKRTPRQNCRVSALPHAWMRRIHRWMIGTLIASVVVGMYAITPTVLGDAQYQASEHSRVIERPWANAPKYSKQEEFCLTQAVYYEAGTQSRKGKEAVALVILNRVAHGHYPSTICGVVHQSMIVGDKKICQFSYHCLFHYTPNPKLWAESKAVAQKSLKNLFDRDIIVLLGRAQFFHAVYITPQWAKEKHRVAKIGDHVFYREGVF